MKIKTSIQAGVILCLLALVAAPALAQQPAAGPQDVRIEHDLLGEKAIPADAYYGIQNAFAAAERAGGFAPLDKWVAEMEKADIVIRKDGKMWLRYAYWKPGEIEPRTNREYTHNIRFDITPPYDDGAPSMVVIQWYEDGTAQVVYPPKFATGEFQIPSWVKK